MAIDPSIPLQVGQGVPPPVNMLDTFGKYQGIANAMTTNDAIKAHIAQTQQQTAQSGNEAFQQGFGEFLALPPNLQTQGTARQLVDSYLSRGIIGPAQHHDAMRAIDAAPDQAGLVNLAQRAALHVASPDNRIQHLSGVNTIINAGGDQQPMNASTPFGRAIAGNNGQPVPPGLAPTGGNVTNTMDPATGSQMVPFQVVTPEQSKALGVPVGSQTSITRAQQAILGGAGAVAGPAAGQRPQRPAAASGAPGAIPGAYPTPAATAPPAIPSIPQPPTTNEADIGLYNRDQSVIPDKARSVQTLDKALHASALATAGRGSAAINSMRQFLATLTPDWMNALGIKPFEIDNMNYDLLHKYTTDYARGVSVGGTDQARAQTEASNASPSISPEAARKVMKDQIGQLRQDMAKVQSSPSGPLYYGKHAATFSNDTDPTAFQIDHMTPAELAAIPPAGTPAGDKFRRSLAIGKAQGLIQ